MILQLEEYKRFLPLNTLQGYNASITEATETRALYKWLVKYLGATLVEAVADNTANEDLMLKVKPVLASFTWFEALPFLNLVLTGSGFGIISNPNMAPASSERVRSLAVGLLESAHNYLDSLLVFLETNVATYPTWNKCSLNPGSLLEDADKFEARLRINSSRVTFIDLIPFIKQTETLQIGNIISPQFLASIIAGSDLNARPLIESACAYWAWQRLVQPPKTAAEKFADAEFLHSQKKLLLPKLSPEMAAKTGEAYMLQAKQYIETNIANYPIYASYAYEAPYENTAENGFYIS